MNIALSPRYLNTLSLQRLGEEKTEPVNKPQTTDAKTEDANLPELDPPNVLGDQFEKPEEYVSETPHEEKTKTTLKAGTIAGLAGGALALCFIVAALLKGLTQK